MEVLKEAAPLVNRMTVLHDPSQRNHEAFLRVIDTAAISLKVEVSKASIQDEAAIDRTVAALADRTDRGLVVLPGPVNNTHRRAIIEGVARYRLSTIYPFEFYARDGGLLYYGDHQVDQWPKAAVTLIVSLGAKNLATFRCRHLPNSS